MTSSSTLPPRRTAPVRSGRPAFSKHEIRRKQKRQRRSAARPCRRRTPSGGKILRKNASSSPPSMAANARRLPKCRSPAAPPSCRNAPPDSRQGVMAFLARITGFNALTAFRHAREDKQRIAEQRQQTAALIRRHRREMQNFRHQESALGSLDKRERRSLETSVAPRGVAAVSPVPTAPSSLNSRPPPPARPKSGRAMTSGKKN